MNKNKKILKLIAIGTILSSNCYLYLSEINALAFSYSDMELPGAERRTYSGSNYWLSSNLREWLNSDDLTVRYTCNAPSTGYVNSYPYDKEAGFLTGFTKEERDAIAITERGNIFGGNDTVASTDGKKGYPAYNHNSSKSINFEYPGLLKTWNNNGQVVANDKVFLLTFKEVAEYVQNRGWSVVKKPSAKVTSKFGYASYSNLPYYIYHPMHSVGNEYLEIVSANASAISVDSNAMDSRGIAPAIHLKKDTTVKRVKEYDIKNVNETWTEKTSLVKATDLNIGDIVEFGSHLAEPIEWRVINKTDDGYPLLFAEKIIDVKAFDAKGDTSRRFSYIDLEDKFPIADVSTKTFQIQNIQGSSDKTQVSMELLNEEKLFERSNNSFIMNLKIKDDSGIAYIEYPNGNRVVVNSKEYTFNYEVAVNGNYEFGLMDTKGNFRYFVLPVGNINLPPKVDISTNTTSWTNQNVTVDIKATNDVGWEASLVNQSVRDVGGGSWGNYTTYMGKQVRVTGKVEYISDKNNFNPSLYSYGPCFTYKRVAKSGDEYNLNWTWPMPWSKNLNTLKTKNLNGEGQEEFDFIYTVGSDYFGSFSTRTHISLSALSSGNTTIKWTDLKFELLDNSDFAITKIELPTGNSVNLSSYKDTISKEGETIYSYKVHDNRNMITEKTITARIDKSLPKISIEGNPNSFTNENVVLKLNFKDDVSGIKEIIMPNGRELGNNQKEINKEYLITENGNYTFSIIDQAGNQTTQTITVDKIDKTAPIITATKEIASDKLSGFININIKDTLSGVNYIILPNGVEVKNVSTYKYPINNNGFYNFTSYDKVGNNSFTIVNVTELNTDIISSGIERIEYKLTGATTQNWTTYTSAFYIKNEGITYITARSYDKAGNVSLEETSQVKIDKTKPINNGIKIELKWN